MVLMHYIACSEMRKMGEWFFRVFSANMTENTLTESLFLVENTIKIIYLFTWNRKRILFQLWWQPVKQNVFDETPQYLQNLNHKTPNLNSNYGHVHHIHSLRSVIHLQYKRVFHTFLSLVSYASFFLSWSFCKNIL